MLVKVLGLDGSLQNFGIAVCTIDTDTKELVSVDQLILSKTEKSKDKKKKRSDDDFDRFRAHWMNIETVLAMDTIHYVFGEIPSGAQDARASFAFGGITAMLAGLSLTNNVVTVTPTEVKLAATGYKHADKDDVIAAVYARYPTANWLTSGKPNAMAIKKDDKYLTNANEHLADAVGTVLAGLKK